MQAGLLGKLTTACCTAVCELLARNRSKPCSRPCPVTSCDSLLWIPQLLELAQVESSIFEATADSFVLLGPVDAAQPLASFLRDWLCDVPSSLLSPFSFLASFQLSLSTTQAAQPFERAHSARLPPEEEPEACAAISLSLSLPGARPTRKHKTQMSMTNKHYPD